MLPELLNDDDLRVLHAALCLMIFDRYSPAGNLSAAEWARAGDLFSLLKTEIISRESLSASRVRQLTRRDW